MGDVGEVGKGGMSKGWMSRREERGRGEVVEEERGGGERRKQGMGGR